MFQVYIYFLKHARVLKLYTNWLVIIVVLLLGRVLWLVSPNGSLMIVMRRLLKYYLKVPGLHNVLRVMDPKHTTYL